PEPIRELLAAINETLTLPAPAGDRDDLVRYEMHASGRISLVKIVIRDALDGKADLGLAWEARYLRKEIADRPPSYRTPEQYLAELRENSEDGERP
ncbi:hypothetical protein, partial [Streptomyces sp. NPDC055085]